MNSSVMEDVGIEFRRLIESNPALLDNPLMLRGILLDQVGPDARIFIETLEGVREQVLAALPRLGHARALVSFRSEVDRLTSNLALTRGLEHVVAAWAVEIWDSTMRTVDQHRGSPVVASSPTVGSAGTGAPAVLATGGPFIPAGFPSPQSTSVSARPSMSDSSDWICEKLSAEYMRLGLPGYLSQEAEGAIAQYVSSSGLPPSELTSALQLWSTLNRVKLESREVQQVEEYISRSARDRWIEKNVEANALRQLRAIGLPETSCQGHLDRIVRQRDYRLASTIARDVETVIERWAGENVRGGRCSQNSVDSACRQLEALGLPAGRARAEWDSHAARNGWTVKRGWFS